MVSQDLGSKQTTIGTGSSFEILWNEKIIMTSRWAKDEGMTQIHLFIQGNLNVSTNMLLISSLNSTYDLSILIHIHEDPY